MTDDANDNFHWLNKRARELAVDPHSSRRQQIDAAWAAADANPTRRHLLPGEVGAGATTSRWSGR